MTRDTRRLPRLLAILSFAIFSSFALFSYASAATNVYYSVGSDTTTNYMTGTPTVTISTSGATSTATFSTAQTASSTGVGDIITYGGVGRVFITTKVSTTQWTVETATGGTVTATTSAPVNSITHAFAGLRNAISTGISGNATSTNFLNTSDLVGGNYILNIPCYNDNKSADIGVNITLSGITTDSTHYLRIYTPSSSTTEANASQRHVGYYDPTQGYALVLSNGDNGGEMIDDAGVSLVRFDGLQIYNDDDFFNDGDIFFDYSLDSLPYYPVIY
ncbi:MAG: hypothetical protein KGI79_02995, partial [Patescibacteria group bacterium]|nr:hypothetical protein [Patescibacteria group bacterium]